MSNWTALMLIRTVYFLTFVSIMYCCVRLSIYIGILFFLSLLISTFYHNKLKPYCIKCRNNLSLVFTYKLQSKNSHYNDKYIQSPSRIGTILHKSIIHETYQMLDYDILSLYKYPSITHYTPYNFEIPNLTKIKWNDIKNDVNGKSASILAESIHKFGFAVLELDEHYNKMKTDSYKLVNEYFKHKSKTINPKISETFKYLNENNNREILEFNNDSCCKLYDQMYKVSQKINIALMNYAEKHCKLLRNNNINISAILKQHNNHFNWNKCHQMTILRILYYSLMNISNKYNINKKISDLLYNIFGIKIYGNKPFDKKKVIYLTHCDFGLVTLGAQATNYGLQIMSTGNNKWINAYSLLKDNEIIVYCGYTMSCLTGNFYKPLLHRVKIDLLENKSKPRLSMPFFYRLPDDVKIPLFKTTDHEYNGNVNDNENIIDKWVYVGQIIGNIKRQRLLRSVKIYYLRWIWMIITYICCTYFPHKQSLFFDVWIQKWK
eukprot:295501_1